MTATPLTSLSERWTKAGPPPLGVSLSRWWDARLVELNDAIRQTADDATEPEIDHALAFGEPVEVVVPPRPGPIREGSAWVWEPLQPTARQEVRVAAVELRSGAWWVQTENTASNNGSKVGARHWNELDRFVEACVLTAPAGDDR
ncbi:hypothetical protein [Streptomyces sp. NPDC002692]